MTNLLLLTPVGPQEGAFEGLLQAGRHAQDNLDYERALALFRQAAAVEPERPEPWAAMARLHESLGERKMAAYCYFLAGERTF
jgi:hypothetical protein